MSSATKESKACREREEREQRYRDAREMPELRLWSARARKKRGGCRRGVQHVFEIRLVVARCVEYSLSISLVLSLSGAALRALDVAAFKFTSSSLLSFSSSSCGRQKSREASSDACCPSRRNTQGCCFCIISNTHTHTTYM